MRSKLQSRTSKGWPLVISCCRAEAEMRVLYISPFSACPAVVAITPKDYSLADSVNARTDSQCSSAGELGIARARNTVAVMPLAMISAMPSQPINGSWSPKMVRLKMAANTMPEY